MTYSRHMGLRYCSIGGCNEIARTYNILSCCKCSPSGVALQPVCTHAGVHMQSPTAGANEARAMYSWIFVCVPSSSQ